ncbi:MAG: MCP four helix bundle domain-containing protein, partial [Pseudomonadota bacterium]
MRWTIRWKLGAAFGVVLLLFGVTAVLAMRTLADNQAKLERLVDVSAESVRINAELRQSIMEIGRHEQAILLSSDPDLHQRREALIDEQKLRIEDLSTRLLGLLDPEVRPLFEE